jgi:Ca2+:H+ antiporter
MSKKKRPSQSTHITPAPGRGFRIGPLDWLLLAVPVAGILEYTHADPLWIFIVSCLAIIPLAGLMGRATENLAEAMGEGIGGLLNATFGNAAELIIALAALSKVPLGLEPDQIKARQEMFGLVKASITGSIIGNVLLVLGLSILVGGLKYPRQTFNRTAAGMGSTLLALAAVSLLLPTLHYQLARVSLGGAEPPLTALLSEEIAGVLLFVYALSLIFSLRTHRHLFAGSGSEEGESSPHHQPEWSRKTAVLVLLGATVGVAVMSEFLVGSVEQAAEAVGMNSVFVGVIVIAIIGNAAEHSTAVMMALKNKMDLTVNIAVGSSIQVALFVAPVLVFASMFMGHPQPLDLHFTLMEVVAVMVSVFVLAQVSQDGESHWMEGVMLLAVYGILALSFYHLLPSMGE